MAFVTLTRLDGTSVAVQAFNNFTLEPVPANLLPTAVPAGTYITFTEDGTRLAVQGTVAAIGAILDAAVSPSNTLFGVQVDPLGNILGSTQLGAGDSGAGVLVSHVPATGIYDLQLTGPPSWVTRTSGPTVTSIEDVNAIGTNSSAVGGFTGVPGQFRVETRDGAVPTDRGFAVFFLDKV